MKSKRSIVYLSHGGGPMPLLGDPDHDEMIKTLKEIAAYFGLSGHLFRFHPARRFGVIRPA
ncbi:hypothetical protein LMJ53_13165 [Rheinheimera sp. UJ51]|uniref:hypothetical protein n=1 Tax=Rheinheimera sp. UJ51 TaxID=2892446 RepID=UPI001E56B461|nr:hypothetical protein [Rheinheimera sp. UJ51]MCC5452672.1 hypothetical protein [Rheinheimera sp. UJ51]